MNALLLPHARCDKEKVRGMPRKCVQESLPPADDRVRGMKQLSQVLKYVMRCSWGLSIGEMQKRPVMGRF